MSWPSAEIDVDETLVRSLLAEQHPDLDRLSIVKVNAGWDNTLWRLGDELLVRLPRRAVAAPLIVNEQRWLPDLAPRLPLPVPAPVRVGQPSVDFPWSWSIVPWLDGSPGDRSPIADPEDTARRLGRFLRALHHDAPAEAPQNPFRGVPLSQRATTFEERVAELATEIDVPGTRRVWERACAAAPWSGPPMWLHGDLHPANTLFLNGTLAGVIDFGDVCSGDPATDRAAAWMLLPYQAIGTFIDAYGVADADLEHRSLGWAILFALMLLAIGLDDKPTYAVVGRSTLARAIEGDETLF